MSTSTAYEIALTKLRLATQESIDASTAYLAGKMSDDAYLEAEAAYAKANIEFDAIFAAG